MMALAAVLVLGLSSSSPSAASSAVADAAKPVPVQVLVLEPTSSVLDGPTRTTVANLMVVELGRERGLVVIGANEVQRLAALESDKQVAGCTQSDCLSELAGALGARYVVFGDVGPLGSRQVLNLNLFDAQQAMAISRTAITFTRVEELPALLPEPLHALTAPLLHTTSTLAPAVVGTTSTGPSPLVPVCLIVAGGVVAASGVGYDLLSPTSDDASFDAYDMLGPAGVVLGVGLAATGVVMLVFGGGNEDG
jgi:hypothetical protein